MKKGLTMLLVIIILLPATSIASGFNEEEVILPQWNDNLDPGAPGGGTWTVSYVEGGATVANTYNPIVTILKFAWDVSFGYVMGSLGEIGTVIGALINQIGVEVTVENENSDSVTYHTLWIRNHHKAVCLHGVTWLRVEQNNWYVSALVEWWEPSLDDWVSGRTTASHNAESSSTFHWSDASLFNYAEQLKNSNTPFKDFTRWVT